MRQSQLFTKTRREAPADETARNAQLLIQAGYIHKEIAGVYSFLPLGLKVIKNIENIIREEMNNIGGIEMKTTVLQNKEIWEKSGRWSDDTIDNWFKTKLKNGGEVGLSFTNEEAYSNILKQHISSYKDLPAYPYDFKEIFRNEDDWILRCRDDVKFSPEDDESPFQVFEMLHKRPREIKAARDALILEHKSKSLNRGRSSTNHFADLMASKNLQMQYR